MNLPSKLKLCRNKKRLTQQQVARMLCVSRKTISGWENSRSLPDINTLVKISNIYEVSLDYLLRDEKLLDEYSIQNNHLIFLRKASMLFYYINIFLCVNMISDTFNYKEVLFPMVPIFFIINIIAFFSYFPIRSFFKNKLYFLVFLVTFFFIFVFFIIINIQLLHTSEYLVNFNKTTLFGFLLGRFFLIILTALDISTNIFLKPKSLRPKN
ncbi:MAG: helix-turn-helix transcriptional regulator [Liquorilactobacillus ghanensis]|uniref:helix-turn-helix domain-containing protein n=3 Tax=Liquorilactobacillus ghanensis TaxID=399370 RepID=UPI0039E985AD